MKIQRYGPNLYLNSSSCPFTPFAISNMNYRPIVVIMNKILRVAEDCSSRSRIAKPKKEYQNISTDKRYFAIQIIKLILTTCKYPMIKKLARDMRWNTVFSIFDQVIAQLQPIASFPFYHEFSF
jgi:hypothetical protein